MNSTPSAEAKLRVLVTGATNGVNDALADWLLDQDGFVVTAVGITDAFTVAETFQPRVVLLDFHGLPVSTASTVARFKRRPPAPLVFVLTHDDSKAMRRRCREAHVDAVFNKTAELDPLRDALAALRRPFGVASA